jgi:hypothetical protein
MRRVEPIRRTVQAALILALLAVAVGCKTKGEPPQQKIEPCSPVAPIASIDPPSLPQDAVTIEIQREQQNRQGALPSASPKSAHGIACPKAGSQNWPVSRSMN